MTFTSGRDLSKVFRFSDLEKGLLQSEIDGFKIGKFKSKKLIKIFDPHEVYVEGSMIEKIAQIKFEAKLFIDKHDIKGFELWGIQIVAGICHSGERLFADLIDSDTLSFVDQMIKNYSEEHFANAIEKFKHEEYVKFKSIN